MYHIFCCRKHDALLSIKYYCYIYCVLICKVPGRSANDFGLGWGADDSTGRTRSLACLSRYTVDHAPLMASGSYMLCPKYEDTKSSDDRICIINLVYRRFFITGYIDMGNCRGQPRLCAETPLPPSLTCPNLSQPESIEAKRRAGADPGAWGVKLCCVCGQLAKSACSKCRSARYCGRDHQTQHWKHGGHKEVRISRLVRVSLGLASSSGPRQQCRATSV